MLPSLCCLKNRNSLGVFLHRCGSVINSPPAITATVTKHSAPKSAPVTINQLPGPLILPILGSEYKSIFSDKARSNLHGRQIELVKKHGNVFAMDYGFGKAVAVACPNLVEEIVKVQDPLPSRGAPLAWVEYTKSAKVPTALLISSGEDWERKRKAVRSMMLRLNAMEHSIWAARQVSDDFCDVIAWKRDSHNFVANLPEEIYHWAFEGIITILFGTRAGCLERQPPPQGKEFIDALNHILESCFNSLAVSASLQRKLNTKLWQKSKAAWDKVFKSVQHHSSLAFKNLESVTANSFPILVSMMSNTKMTNDEIESMMAEFLFGGVDTTSNATSFLLYNLANNPLKQEKLKAEIEQIIKNKEVTLSDLQSMTYLRCCIKESMRLYPILFIYGRVSNKSFVSQNGNISINSGDDLLFMNYAIGRSEELWNNPNEFIPERFLREEALTQSSEKKSVTTRFGFGTRSCIGKRIAELEMSMVIIKILQRFELTIDSRYEFLPVSRSVLTPGKQIPIRFNDRN